MGNLDLLRDWGHDRDMVTHDKEEARKEAVLRLKGFNVVGAREG